MKVFVFGAGVSAHAGLPLGRELMRVLREWLEADEVASLRKGFEIWRELERVGVLDPDEDLELNLSRLDVEAEMVRRKIQRSGRIRVESSALAREMPGIVTAFFESKHREVEKDPQRSEYLRSFLRRWVRPGDAILTFNYDCLPERLLREEQRWSLRDGYGISMEGTFRDLQAEARSEVEVIKLHGSIGWVSSFGPISLGFRQGWPTPANELLIVPSTLKIMGYDHLELPAEKRGISELLPIGLPSYLKNLSAYPLPWLWKRASELLTNADEILMLGYSLPDADSAARTLFLTNIPQGRRFVYFWSTDMQRPRNRGPV